MAVEYITIDELKSKTKTSTSGRELTYESVRDSICEQTLSKMQSSDIGSVLKQDKSSAKIWYLTLKYGVVPVSAAKIVANNAIDAQNDAKSYIQKIKNNTAGVAVKREIEGALAKKKEALSKAKGKREEEKAKYRAMSETQKAAYRADKKAALEKKKIEKEARKQKAAEKAAKKAA